MLACKSLLVLNLATGSCGLAVWRRRTWQATSCVTGRRLFWNFASYRWRQMDSQRYRRSRGTPHLKRCPQFSWLLGFSFPCLAVLSFLRNSSVLFAGWVFSSVLFQSSSVAFGIVVHFVPLVELILSWVEAVKACHTVGNSARICGMKTVLRKTVCKSDRGAEGDKNECSTYHQYTRRLII